MDCNCSAFNFSDYTEKEIRVGGGKYKIEKIIIHNNTRNLNSRLYEGDAKPLMDFMKSTSDIASITLEKTSTLLRFILKMMNREKLLELAKEVMQVRISSDVNWINQKAKLNS